MALSKCNKCKEEVDFFSNYDSQDKLCFKCYREEWGEPSPQEEYKSDAKGGLSE